MNVTFDRIDVERLSPQSRWALEHLAFTKADEDIDDRELGRRHELKPRVVKRMLDDLYAEIRAQQVGAVLPELAKHERESLKAQLEKHGQLYPVLVEQNGKVLDGHSRKQLLEELGMPVWTHPIDVTDDEEARAIGLVANLSRRHLDSRRLRNVAAAEILHDPSRSDRAIAELLGVHRNTVGRARKELLKLGVVSHGDTRIGKDGVAQPAGKPARQPDAHDREALVGALIVDYIVQVDDDGTEHTLITLDSGRSYELLEISEES